MTDKPPAKPDKSEVTLLELPGFKVSLANETGLSAPAKLRDDAFIGGWVVGAIIAAIVLGGLVVALERVRQGG